MPKMLVALFILITMFSLVAEVRAETLSSDNYTIRMGNFNMTSGLKSSASYSLTDTVGQTAAEFFSGTGYHVKAGFQYIYTLYDFSFSISSLLVNLGGLSPNSFASGSNTLTVSAPGQGYSVAAIEADEFQNEVGDAVNDTTCDSGTCTETSANVWSNTGTYGFGYNVSGNDIAADFLGSTYFRPFPNASLGETPATIMSTSASGKNRTATVTYQANISPSQASGTYSTQITYIATPAY